MERSIVNNIYEELKSSIVKVKFKFVIAKDECGNYTIGYSNTINYFTVKFIDNIPTCVFYPRCETMFKIKASEKLKNLGYRVIFM